MANAIKSTSSSCLWKVTYSVDGKKGSKDIFITLNDESTSLKDDVLDALGFIVFVHEKQKHTHVLAAIYMGVCLS